MTKTLPNSTIYRIDPSLGFLIRQLMQTEFGLDDTVCELCGAIVPAGCQVHHTKYANATIFDLRFACSRCQNQPENKGLK